MQDAAGGTRVSHRVLQAKAAWEEERNPLLRVGARQLCECSGHKFPAINESQWSHNLPLCLCFLSNSSFRRCNLSKMLEEPLKRPCFTAVSPLLVFYLKGGIISPFRDQSSVFLDGSCPEHRPPAALLRQSSSANPANSFLLQPLFLV